MTPSELSFLKLEQSPDEKIEVSVTVKKIKPYEPVSSLQAIKKRPGQKVYKLDWNETTIPPSKKVIEAIHKFLSNGHNLNWYPDITCFELLKKLKGYLKLPADCLLVTNGSDDGLELICKTYIDEGDEVIVPVPTYTHFQVYVGVKGGTIIKVMNDDPFKKNLKGLISAVTHKTKLIYLINPNNPTGVMYSEEEIRKVLELFPGVLLVLDEAYGEFCRISMKNLVQEYPNLIITRTFSKAFGLAGLRVGYIISSPDRIHDLSRIFNPKSVNVLGQIAAAAALDDMEYLENYVENVDMSKKILQTYFKTRGIEVYITPANYILLKFERPQMILMLLEKEGVYLRDRSSIPQMNKLVRMSVGTVEQTAELIDIFDKIFERLLSEECETIRAIQ